MKIKEILSRSPASKLRTIQPGQAGRGPNLGAQYILHVPSELSTRLNGRHVIAIFCDSWSFDERHGGPIVNGGIDLCNEFGVIGVFPFPHPRLRGFYRGWNLPNGPVRSTRSYNDAAFIRELILGLQKEYGSAEFVLIGFSDAGMFVEQCNALNPGLIHGVVAVNAPYDPDDVIFPHGSRILSIHGGSNPILPYHGGVGPSFTARARCWLVGGSRAWRSRPDLAVYACAEANGVADQAQMWTEGDVTITQYGDDGPIVDIVVFNGGHMWFGRSEGGEMESPFSRFNAKTGMPPPAFSVNQAIARFYRWEQLVVAH
jgi:poly(3-hydroxybutyrate) depolymerase